MADQQKDTDAGSIPPQPESSAQKGPSSPADADYNKPSQAEGDEATVDEALRNQRKSQK